jgi:hypothetical protein
MWLGHVHVFVIRDALLAMLAVFQAEEARPFPTEDEALIQRNPVQPSAGQRTQSERQQASQAHSRVSDISSANEPESVWEDPGVGAGSGRGEDAKQMVVQVLLEKPRLVTNMFVSGSLRLCVFLGQSGVRRDCFEATAERLF